MTVPTITINGVDVTNVCVSGSWTRRLNRPSVAQVKIPMQEAVDGTVGFDAGDILKIEIPDGTGTEIVFHGMILLCETDTAEDTGYTTFNASDPMELWQWRPLRDDTGDFSKPSIIEDYGGLAPDMLYAMVQNTEGNSTAQGNASLQPPAEAEGPSFLTLGTFEAGSVALTGAPVDWPMTMMEFFSLLVSTGELDGIITPTDPGGGILGTLEGYNGDYGTDLSGSISFDYGQGNYNVRRLRWNRDMTYMVNKYWLYGGPRIGTAADPAGDQHWCFNITGQDPEFDPSGPGIFAPPGGLSVDATNTPVGPPWTDNQLGEQIYNSRVTYGVRMLVDIFDAYDDNCVPGFGTVGRDLFRKRWQIYSWGASLPREIIHVTPTRETEIGTFDIGDLVGVTATSAVRGGFSGAQRVYEYTVSWDEDGVLALSELQTSADMEGV